MPHNPKIITMFAMSIIHILSNAGSELAFSVQAFYARTYYVPYMVSCTPAWSVNAPTAFGRCDRQRERHDTFILKTYCYV